MALQNFQDKVGPVVPASMLNSLDTIRYAVAAAAGGNTSIGVCTGAGAVGPVGIVVTPAQAVQHQGAVSALGAVAAVQVDMSPDTGTFTATSTGITGAPTGTATWYRVGKLVGLFLPAINGVSNATSFGLSGLPAAIQPATLDQILMVPLYCTENNGANSTTTTMQITHASGTIAFLLGGVVAGWTNTGNKGIVTGFTVTYLLN